jgi:hypothetical protein
VVSADEYKYLGQLKRTTENLGGLFDPQPGSVVGNIHERNKPGTQVLGYFSVTQVTHKRKFIRHIELPEALQIKQGIGLCLVEYTCDPRLEDAGRRAFCMPLEGLGKGSNILYAIYDERGNAASYAFVQNECSDCRLHGGVTKRPDYWPPPE